MTLLNPQIRNKHIAGINQIAYTELILQLMQKPMCREELIEATGVHQLTASKWLNLLRSRNLIYVVYWKTKVNQHVAYWMFGYMKEDAPRPKPKSAAQRSRDRRKRNRDKKELANLNLVNPNKGTVYHVAA